MSLYQFIFIVDYVQDNDKMLDNTITIRPEVVNIIFIFK